MRACRIDLVTPARRVRAKPRVAPQPVADKAGQRNTSVVSYFPTRKGGWRMERLRHYAHRSLAALLETDPRVLRWTTEAESLALGDGLKFTPSFWVVGSRHCTAIRVLRADRLKGARHEERHRAVRDAYGRLDVAFEVRTEEDIEADPRLPVAEEILWHRPRDVPAGMSLRVDTMAAAPPATLGELHARLGGAAGTWPLVIALVAQGCIELESTDRLDAGTRVLACRMRGHE